MKAYTSKQSLAVITNILSSCRNITRLSNTGYYFLINCGGFKGEYDYDSFVVKYQQAGNDLYDDILLYESLNSDNPVYNDLCGWLKRPV